jgi:hypothetical protein
MYQSLHVADAPLGSFNAAVTDLGSPPPPPDAKPRQTPNTGDYLTVLGLLIGINVLAFVSVFVMPDGVLGYAIAAPLGAAIAWSVIKLRRRYRTP